MKLRSVCVFCGAAGGDHPAYLESARATGSLLAREGIELVYGGGHRGMMGELADAALAAGGRVVGIIPRHLMKPEVAHRELTELQVVASMHERKQRMADRAEAFLVLPGGFGTLDELFEMTTWRQLGLHRKPLVMVNSEGYYDALLAFVAEAAAHGFIHGDSARLLQVEASPAAALALAARLRMAEAA